MNGDAELFETAAWLAGAAFGRNDLVGAVAAAAG
jgi:hypothetical protein